MYTIRLQVFHSDFTRNLSNCILRTYMLYFRHYLNWLTKDKTVDPFSLSIYSKSFAYFGFLVAAQADHSVFVFKYETKRIYEGYD